MYGLARLLGVGPAIVLGGRRFSVHARTLRDYALIEARIGELRSDPFDFLRWLCLSGDGNQPLARKLFDRLRIFEEDAWTVTFQDCYGWLDTFEGRIFGIWLAIRHAEPSISLEWTQRAVFREMERPERSGSGNGDFWLDVVLRSIDVANCDDELAATENLGAEESKKKPSRPNYRLGFWELITVDANLGGSYCGLSMDDFWNLTLRQYRLLRSGRDFAFGQSFERASLLTAHQERCKVQADRGIENLALGKRWNSK